MNNTSSTTGSGWQQPSTAQTQAKVAASLRRRYRNELLFRGCGVGAVTLGIAFVVFLFGSIIGKGASVFRQSYVTLDVFYDPGIIDPTGQRNIEELRVADYQALIRAAMRAQFPQVEGRENLRELSKLVSSAAADELQNRVMANPALVGQHQSVRLLTNPDVDWLVKGRVQRTAPAAERRLSDQQVAWIDTLQRSGRLALQFNREFFRKGDSRDPEQAGVWGAVSGSFLTLVVTLLLSFPVGVAAAVYLEEFSRRNRFTDIIEVNINNLAAVPSIVYGLLGLSVFINFFGMPRSSPLVGGCVLALLTLPTIIIASRAALKAVPPSIREAALGMGASHIQTVAHHVLPLAMPGMLTGAIIGMARALGESAPLLMIGMVAFIVEVPHSVTDAATVLPVQIFLWSDSPERAFVERTSGAIIVLLLFLLVMNATAVVLRSRFEKRW